MPRNFAARLHINQRNDIHAQRLAPNITSTGLLKVEDGRGSLKALEWQNAQDQPPGQLCKAPTVTFIAAQGSQAGRNNLDFVTSIKSPWHRELPPLVVLSSEDQGSSQFLPRYHDPPARCLRMAPSHLRPRRSHIQFTCPLRPPKQPL